MANYQIRKASGKLEEFSEAKLRDSLNRSGASKQVIDLVVKEIRNGLYEGIPTKKIYQIAFQLLKARKRSEAARYKLKKAIMELGPDGFAFELLLGEVLKAKGYNVRVGEIVQGRCINHEIDVIAEKNHELFIIECKYHNLPGKYCDVKIPLYVQSRYLDVMEGEAFPAGDPDRLRQGWLVNNTRFTSDAIKYGNCVGLKLISWDYPEEGSLKDLIDQTGLHPITSLTTLTTKEKQFFLAQKMVLCRNILNHPEKLTAAGINEKKQKEVLRECEELFLNY